MVSNRLLVTLDGSEIKENGVSVDSFIAALDGVQDALRLMVEHLGSRQRGLGQPPKWVRDQSRLRLVTTRSGSFVAELTLEPTPDKQPYLDNYGEQAIAALLQSSDSALPSAVADRLAQILTAFPDNARLWLGNNDAPHRVEITPVARPGRTSADIDEVRLFGWLKEVNWDRRTAQLHRYNDSLVQMRFNAALDEEMLRYATQYIEVTGHGTLNQSDGWTTIQVTQISATRHWREPFDLQAFLSDPRPKPFDPERVTAATEPFDVDDFIRVVHEGRDAGRWELPH